MSDSVRCAAARYIERGFAVVPISPKEKRPTAPLWSITEYTPSDIPDDWGVGILTGWRSGDPEKGFLVCVDLDSDDARDLADGFLPPTDMVDGRKSSPRTHRWYRAVNIPSEWVLQSDSDSAVEARRRCIHPGPAKRSFDHAETGDRIVEILGSGQQAVVPPSIHSESGEQRTWDVDDGEPATVEFAELLDKVTRLAEACGWKPKQVKGPKPRAAKKSGTTKPATETPETPEAPAAWVNFPMEVRVSQCRPYLQAIPEWDLARSGKGGSNETYRIARLIVNGFAVDDREKALVLLRSYNSRLATLRDEWTEGELQHKLDDALAAPPDPRFPKGCKLRAEGDEDAGNPYDHNHIARRVLKLHRCVWWRGGWYRYHEGRYEFQSKDDMKNLIGRFLDEHQARLDERTEASFRRSRERYEAKLKLHVKGEAEPKEPKRPKTRVIACEAMKCEVLSAMQHRSALDAATEPDTYISTGKPGPFRCIKNGLLNPTTRELVPHDPDYFTLCRLDVAFDRNATAPEWLRIVSGIMRDAPELISVLQEVFGYVIHRTFEFEKCFFFTGEGANGKSTVLAALEAMIGERHISNVPLEMFGERFHMVETLGKVANVVRDANEVDKFASGILKAVATGESIQVERKGQDAFPMKPTAKFLFACNTLPRFHDRSGGMWRRPLIIPFDRIFRPDEQEKGINTPSYWRASGELSGMLNWSLDGLARLLKRKAFTESQRCVAVLEEHRRESNPEVEFLTSTFTFDPDAKPIPSHELYGQYKSYCESNGFQRPLSSNTFGKSVNKLFPESRSEIVRISGSTSPVRCRLGLRRNGDAPVKAIGNEPRETIPIRAGSL